MLDKNLLDFIKQRYEVHTIILYGSRARGDWDNNSDYDIFGISDNGDGRSDYLFLDEEYLDIKVYPIKKLDNIESFVYQKPELYCGRVLCQRNTIGSEFMNVFIEIYRRGPNPLSVEQKMAFLLSTRRALQCIQESNVVSNYKRHKLLFMVLKIYFWMRDMWYTGPKEGLEWLKHNDPEAYTAFQTGLKSYASYSEIERLVSYVTQSINGDHSKPGAKF